MARSWIYALLARYREEGEAASGPRSRRPATSPRGDPGRHGRNRLETELRRLGVRQKNGKPSHPQTQGKIERFWQTLKTWLAVQAPQPGTLTQLQALLAGSAN